MNLEDIDLSEYNLVKADYVIKNKLEKSKFYYDIEVTDDHSFYITDENGNFELLSHNCDGYHIRSLLINLFYNWFPWLVEQGRVHLLETPLVSIGDRSRKYFYSMEDFKNFSGQKTHVRYLKGLGSLALSDWEHVMENKLLVQIRKDAKSTQNLEMAFGKLSSLRKDWLSAE
jgi:hypothetical protein